MKQIELLSDLPQLKSKIPQYVFDTAAQIIAKGHQAYLVGGGVRDLLLGKEPQDYDIATDAYPEVIEAIFPKSIPTGAKFGTMVVVVTSETGERFDIEVTTFRSETDYFGGRWPAKVEFTKTIEEDLSRRDFTINALALDMSKVNEANNLQALIIDPFNGLEDLQHGIIRAVRNPEERFAEDGLRPVRACRLAAQLNFDIEPITWQAIPGSNHITQMVSVERFREELMKLLLKSPKPSIGLRLMQQSGILKLFIPELEEGMGVTQPEFHSFDVFEHSILTCDVAEDSIKLAALFHDIGKPRTMTKDEYGTHFYGHDLTGAEMTKEIMKRLKFSNQEIDYTANLVRWHMFYYPSADWRKQLDIDGKDRAMGMHDEDFDVVLYGEKGTPNQGGWSDGAVRRFIRNVGGVDAVNDLMKLRIADVSSNPKAAFNRKELDVLSERVSAVVADDMALKVTDLAINGQQLMEQLQIQPGPVLGKVLNYLLEQVLDDVKLNKSDTLLELAKNWLAQQESASNNTQ